jgi:hypothetical protein
MKKQYSTPTLTTHGNVAEITQLLGKSDKDDFLFFPGSSSPATNSATNSPITGDGSVDLHQ